MEKFRLLERNLSETYRSIAEGIPGTTVTIGASWTAATNSFRHPICNFAICDDVRDADGHGLRRLADRRAQFNVYVSRFDGEDQAHRSLDEAGFERVYSLAFMARDNDSAQGAPRPVLEAELRAAVHAATRRRVADYMAAQFFGSQSAEAREKIAAATSCRDQLKLYELSGVETAYGPVGAVMLHSTPGVLGLYNLCISPPLRLKGYGSWIVLSIQWMAKRESVILGLQCDPSLAAWYGGLGLEQVGTVDVYGLKRSVSYNARY